MHLGEMPSIKPPAKKVSWSNVGAGAAAGFLLPSFLGIGGGGAAATPVGELISYLPLVLLGGGALYAYSVLKK